MTGAEIIVKTLIYNKVKFIFGYPGGAVMPIYDSLFTYKKQIKHILTRHEQGSIHAAQGYARVTGKPGICLSTSGPGSSNLITGLADALIDSTPLLCITGQVSSNLLGTDAFQEIDIIDISIPVTKWNFQITKPDQIFEVISKGLNIATNGRPGPILIDITKNTQVQQLNQVIIFPPKTKTNLKTQNKINKKELQKVIKTIKKARKPIIIIGQGVKLANAENQLKQFAEKTNIPVASTLLGMGILKTNHNLNYGMLGMHGNYQNNILILKSDLIIAIGLRFDDRLIGNIKTISPKTLIIHIDIDNYEINKRLKPTIYLLGNLKHNLNYLIKNFKTNSTEKWVKTFNLLKKVERKYVKEKEFIKNKIGITMPEVINYINLYKKTNCILVTDVGQHQMSASRYFNFTTLKSQITSGGLGTMGFALPAAIGAKIGAKRRQVICIVGDGGFQMTIQELGTIMQYEIPIKIIILNNNFLGMVKQWQDLFFNRRFSNTKIYNPNFTNLSKAYNIKSKKVFVKEKLKENIKKMLKSKEVFLIEILVEKEYNTLPMIPTEKSVSKICF
ncbi:Acetolactate synthase large subunit [Candidatus Karelsulcia muelleri]|uniref:biosynthetic-type acetolactate synthase large subunit n=1 Tax=Candidatus Karelsulcia muelleri TaxID=336810 RepID=UPI001FF2A467|nr:biosynthetic-type acetolactate synthase large subunit [Candidatus Karelsulcia muelleri]UOQ27812.1 Acetolactate synthase large subunit [Candidatus Karelsulcia muelleri]